MNTINSDLLGHFQRCSGREILVVTGAGISAASGIPTFRGNEPNAIWRQHQIRLATFEYFLSDPVGQWVWYLERFESAQGATPNQAHESLVLLEDWVEASGGRFQLVTQNIDILHELAGTRNLIKVHGTMDRVRCSARGCSNAAPCGTVALPADELEVFRTKPSIDLLPKCQKCGSTLRAHVLFFDEQYSDHVDYRFAEVEKAASRADIVLFIGTSFSVGVTDLFLQFGMRRRIPMFSIDPSTGLERFAGLTQIVNRAEEVLPDLVQTLGIKGR